MRIGAATTTPISVGTQLTGVSLIGVLFFASWPGTTAKVIGFTSIVIVIIGIYLTTRTGEKQSSIKPDSQRAKYILELIIGSLIGFGSCTTLPKIPNASGWSKFPPQTLGMVVTAIIIAIITQRKDYRKLLFDQYTMKNVITGLSTGIGSFMYIISLMLNGVATAFTLSQMSTIIGTLDGIIILREHKTNKELIYTISGLACVVLGGLLIGMFG